VLRDAQQAGAEGAVLVWRLRGDPHGDLAGPRLILDHDATGLDRHGGVGLLVDRLPDHVGGRRERLFQRRGGRRTVVVDDVAPVGLVDEHLAFDGGNVVDDGREGLVVDHHPLAGVFGDIAVVSDDECDRVPDVAHLVPGQRRSRRLG
jgi:hypothetical protein